MLKALISVLFTVIFASIVQASGPRMGTALTVRHPHTNAEAFARGLPPLHPRRQGSRTWSAEKRHQSAVLVNILLNFDDPSFTQASGPIPETYQGINLFCPPGNCGVSRAASYPEWTANSAPNSMFFYIAGNGFPTFTSPTNGLLRLKSLYCAQADGSVIPLVVIGTTSGVTQYQEVVVCTPNSENATPQPPTFNTFDNLPLVDAILFTTANGYGSWAVDDISLTVSV